jgi:hypothetical protein
MLNITVFTPGSPGSTSNVEVLPVNDAPFTLQAQPLSGTEGQGLSNVLVATFTDPGYDGVTNDYSATVTWFDANGQSHTSPGTVTPVGGNTFNICASNAVPYAEEGSYRFTVSVNDEGLVGTLASGAVTVADAPLHASGITLNATQGVSFTGTVATFSDGNPNAAAADFQATIAWGDGETSAGTITPGNATGFQVTGTHTYSEHGQFNASISLSDHGGSNTLASGTAIVADSIPFVHATLTQNPFVLRWARVSGTFSDMELEHHTAVIDWGDGSVSKIDLGVSTGGSFSARHLYKRRFAQHHPMGAEIKITVMDDNGTVSEQEVIPIHFRHHEGNCWFPGGCY